MLHEGLDKLFQVKYDQISNGKTNITLPNDSHRIKVQNDIVKDGVSYDCSPETPPLGQGSDQVSPVLRNQNQEEVEDRRPASQSDEPVHQGSLCVRAKLFEPNDSERKNLTDHNGNCRNCERCNFW
jgi:hypothetical protein